MLLAVGILRGPNVSLFVSGCGCLAVSGLWEWTLVLGLRLVLYEEELCIFHPLVCLLCGKTLID